MLSKASQHKGRQLYQDGMVGTATNARVYTVGPYYVTIFRHYIGCTCEAGRNKQECSHALAALMADQARGF